MSAENPGEKKQGGRPRYKPGPNAFWAKVWAKKKAKMAQVIETGDSGPAVPAVSVPDTTPDTVTDADPLPPAVPASIVADTQQQLQQQSKRGGNNKRNRRNKQKEKEDADGESVPVVPASPRRPRPNYFLAVQLCHDPRTQHVISQVQDHMVSRDPRLRDVLVDPAAAHLTLFVLSLRNEEVEAARHALESFTAHPTAPLSLDLGGLSAFRKDVLYLDVCGTEGRDTLVGLADSLRAHYRAQGLGEAVGPSDEPMKPHCTIAKMSQLVRSKKKGKKENQPQQEEGQSEKVEEKEGEGMEVDAPPTETPAPAEPQTPPPRLKGIDRSTYAGLQFDPSTQTMRIEESPTVQQEGETNEESEAGPLPTVWVPGVQVAEIQLLRMLGRVKGGYYPVETVLPLTEHNGRVPAAVILDEGDMK